MNRTKVGDRVFWAFAKAPEGLTGYRLMMDIDGKSGTLYPLLHRWEQEGILTGQDEVFGNQVRRRYTLTEKGRLRVPPEPEKPAQPVRLSTSWMRGDNVVLR